MDGVHGKIEPIVYPLPPIHPSPPILFPSHHSNGTTERCRAREKELEHPYWVGCQKPLVPQKSSLRSQRGECEREKHRVLNLDDKERHRNPSEIHHRALAEYTIPLSIL